MRIVRFGFVGLVNSLFGLSIIYLCKFIGMTEVTSNVVGYLCGLILSFQLNRTWTFGITQRSQASHFLRFVFAFLLAYGVNVCVLLYLLSLNLNSYLAQAASIPIYAIVFYLLCVFFVFRDQT